MTPRCLILSLLSAASTTVCAASPAAAAGAADRTPAVYWVADGVRLGRATPMRRVALLSDGFRGGALLRTSWPAAAEEGAGRFSLGASAHGLPAVDVRQVMDGASRDWAAQLLGTASVAGLD